MLLGPAQCRQSSGEGEGVHGLRVLGLDLERAAQMVESLRAVTLLAEDGAQVLWIAMDSIQSIEALLVQARWYRDNLYLILMLKFFINMLFSVCKKI
jgi:hypothetical protein